MYYKTYKKQPTKRIKKEKDKQFILSLFLAIFSLLSLFSAITLKKINNELKEDNQPTSTINILMIKDISIPTTSPDNFRLAHEASAQACAKHGLATTTPDGLSLSDCVADLLSIAATETGASFNFHAIGDSGNSVGLFQINSYYHPQITTAQRQDPFYSADWTLTRMINNHYKTNRDYSIRRHNGGINWRTAQYLEKVNYYKNLLINN